MAQFPALDPRTPIQDSLNSNAFSRPIMQWFQAITNRFNATPPTITGSRGGNAALADLLTKLDSAGIVKDNTTP